MKTIWKNRISNSRKSYIVLIVLSACITSGCSVTRYLPHSLKNENIDKSKLATIEWDGSWRKKNKLMCIDNHDATTVAKYYLMPGHHLITYYSEKTEIKKEKGEILINKNQKIKGDMLLIIDTVIISSKIFDAMEGVEYTWEQVISSIESNNTAYSETQVRSYPEYRCSAIYSKYGDTGIPK